LACERRSRAPVDLELSFLAGFCPFFSQPTPFNRHRFLVDCWALSLLPHPYRPKASSLSFVSGRFITLIFFAHTSHRWYTLLCDSHPPTHRAHPLSRVYVRVMDLLVPPSARILPALVPICASPHSELPAKVREEFFLFLGCGVGSTARFPFLNLFPHRSCICFWPQIFSPQVNHPLCLLLDGLYFMCPPTRTPLGTQNDTLFLFPPPRPCPPEVPPPVGIGNPIHRVPRSVSATSTQVR